MQATPAVGVQPQNTELYSMMFLCVCSSSLLANEGRKAHKHQVQNSCPGHDIWLHSDIAVTAFVTWTHAKCMTPSSQCQYITAYHAITSRGMLPVLHVKISVCWSRGVCLSPWKQLHNVFLCSCDKRLVLETEAVSISQQGVSNKRCSHVASKKNFGLIADI